jgi:hypothetical protein
LAKNRRHSFGGLFQIGTDDFDNVVRGFFRGLRIMRHVVEDVILKELAHQAVDGSARGGEALQDVGALLVIVQPAQDAFELPDHFLRARYEVEFFPREV